MEIGWIDFSKDDRKKVDQILSILKPEGQLDELGVGYVRDSFSNKLFPGISTIQTRAKYLFIVPYILRDFLRLSVKDRRKTTPARFLKDEEHKIKNQLKNKYQGQPNSGVIGVSLSTNRYIVRAPSEIYWNGLKVFQCLDNGGLSLEAYLRNASSQGYLELSNNDDEQDDVDINNEDIFRIKVPLNDPSWRDDLDIILNKDEADFLVHQIEDKSNVKLASSLTHELFSNEVLLSIFLDSNSFQDFVLKAKHVSVPVKLRELLTLSFDFALFIEGAHLLYNHLLREAFLEGYTGEYLEDFKNWFEGLQLRMINYNGFSIGEIISFQTTRKFQTEYFLKQWWQFVQEAQNDYEVCLVKMIDLIKKRESIAKGQKSRLRNTVQYNSDLKFENQIGLPLFQYRFQNAKRIITDINTARRT